MKSNHTQMPTWVAALKIAATYAIIGALWILCSGWLLNHLVPNQLLLAKLEAVKGWFYVLVTAALLGWWLNRYFQDIRRTMELLRKSETRFMSIFQASPVAVAISRLSDGVFIGANEAFVELYGYPLEEILGHTSEQLRLWHSGNRKQVIAELSKSNRVVVEMQSRRKNGEVRDLLAFLQLIELDDEPCILGTLMDVTERKKVETALREGDERLRFALESCHIGTWDLDLADHTAVRSLEHARIFGYDDPHLPWTRETFIEHILPEDRALVSEKIRHAIETQSQMSFECRIRRVDGQICWIWVAGRYRVDAGGKTRHLAGVIQDITERKAHVLEIEHLSRLYATMSQINQTIVRVNSQEELAREVARVAVQIGNFKIAWVGRYNPRMREVTPLGWAGEQWETVRKFRHCLEGDPEQRCLCTSVIRKNRSCVFNDLSIAGEMSEWLTEMRQAGINAAAVFPIRVREAVWGVFGVYEAEPNVFQDKEIALLEEVAMDIGYAVENIDNEEQRQQAEKFQLLSTTILGILNEPLTLQEAGNAILAQIKKETGLDAVGIRLKDGDDFPYFSTEGLDKDFLVTENSLVLRSEAGTACRDADGQICLQCICGMVLAEKCGPPSDSVTAAGSLWTNDSRALLKSLNGNDPRFAPRNRCVQERFLSMALIPIRVDQQMIGLLHLNDRRKDRFTPTTIRFFESLAASFGIAVKRKQAEDSLRESEERLRLFIEHAPAALGIFDRDMRYIAVSNRWISDFGLGDREIIGQSHYEVFPEIDDSLKDIHRRGLAGEILGADDHRFERADGSVQYLHWAMHPWHDSTGAIGGIGIFTEDITKRKQAEDAAIRSEAHLRTLVDTLPDLVWLKDPQGVYLSCNSRFESFFGAPEAEVVGKTDYDFFDRELADFFRANDAAAIAAGGLRVNEEEVTFASDGHREILETIKTPMFDADGKLIGVLGIARDITMRRQQEKERVNLEAQLQQAQKMESIGRLAGGVAHDFNNMLSVILGHTDLLLEQFDQESQAHDDLAEIRKAGERSADLTRQLLAFARKQTMAPRVIDLNQTLAGMAKMIKRLIGEDIDLVWIPGEDVWPVKIDPGQIDQMLANLCVNARDAIAGVGKVTIETGNCIFDEAYCTDHAEVEPGEYVMLAVSDDGCGMDGETMSHLFEPFFTTKELGKGTGLGLAMVYGVVKQNNGIINVASEPGQGATFTIYLPRHVAKMVSLQERGEDRQSGRGHETILLVEDEPAILQMTKRMLELEGYAVMTAGTPGEAIRLASELAGGIHLLVTDVVMPEMNGRDLAKNVLPFNPQLKVLFMSGYSTNVIVHRGVIDEGVNFIQKPFSKGDLAAKVREVLDRDEET